MSDRITTIKDIYEEWKVLDNEYQKFEETHKLYQKSVNEFNRLQNECVKHANHHKYRMSQINDSIKRCKLLSNEDNELKKELQTKMCLRSTHITEINESLPKPNGFYLNIVLGGINSSLIDSEQRFKYKEQYERFKLVVTSVILIVSFTDLIFKYRVCDALLHFLLVWYHCTLTIRESILVVNGSRIKGWWRTVHFLITINAGVMVVWPDGLMYNKFRVQFLVYTCYTSFVQFLQFYYQHGCLYRLRALGERYDMDITIQGFHSWMWRGLGFLLPFLYIGYGFQFYNAYNLYNMWRFDKDCYEWQVLVVSSLYFAIFLGNTWTTSMVIYQKIDSKTDKQKRL